MSEAKVTFEGLREKLEHVPNYEVPHIQVNIADAWPCVASCPACYAERLEKAFEELRDRLTKSLDLGRVRAGGELTVLLGKMERKS